MLRKHCPRPQRAWNRVKEETCVAPSSCVPFLSCLHFHWQERIKQNETKTRERKRERETKLGHVSSTSLRGLSWRNNASDACTSFKKKSKFSALISNPFGPILSRTLCSRAVSKNLSSPRPSQLFQLTRPSPLPSIESQPNFFFSKRILSFEGKDVGIGFDKRGEAVSLSLPLFPERDN